MDKNPVSKEEEKIDKGYLELISSNLKEWDGENDEKQFEYLQQISVKIGG